MLNWLKKNKRRIYDYLFKICIVIIPIVAFADKDNYMRILFVTIILIIMIILKSRMDKEDEDKSKKELQDKIDAKKDDDDMHIA